MGYVNLEMFLDTSMKALEQRNFFPYTDTVYLCEYPGGQPWSLCESFVLSVRCMELALDLSLNRPITSVQDKDLSERTLSYFLPVRSTPYILHTESM